MTERFENQMLGMSSFRAEPLHVAQQSRREKLRVVAGQSQPPAIVGPHHHVLLHSSAGHHRDLYFHHTGAAAVFADDTPAAGMLHHDGVVDPDVLDHRGGGAGVVDPDVQASCFYKGGGGLAGSATTTTTHDWFMSCAGAGGGGGDQEPPQGSLLLSSSINPQIYEDSKPALGFSGGYHHPDLQHHHHLVAVAPPPQLCPSYLQEVVAPPPSSSSNQGMEISAAQPWGVVDGANELLLLPRYAGSSSSDGHGIYNAAAVWVNQQHHQHHPHYGSREDDGGEEGGSGFCATQGLSLTLASNPPHMNQVHHQFAGSQDSRASVDGVGIVGGGGFFSPYSGIDVAGSNRGFGSPPHGSSSAADAAAGTSSIDARRAAGAGPLGPFTGYATILKSSKFLKPAQQLLDEFCGAVSLPKTARRGGEAAAAAAMSCSGRASSGGAEAAANQSEPSSSLWAGNSVGSSSSSIYSSTACGGGDVAGPGSSSVAGLQASHHQRPEFQHKKAKLLLMQEEICRRFKQYHQQMQMVVSAFESVVGLSTAAPYASLALKTVSKHFRCLRNAVSDQLRCLGKALGEEFMSLPPSSADRSSCKVDDSLMLKFVDRKNGGSGFHEQHHAPQPVWRPQRGLPECSVAVLRAWLFEHFLHPYPTDTDKHMLASQTGLSRNQVSNWFINARVRLWKPMVEEIHMLETKGISEMDLNNSGPTNKAAVATFASSAGKMAAVQVDDGGGHVQRPSLAPPEMVLPPQMDCSSIGAVMPLTPQPIEECGGGGGYRAGMEQQWHSEKRSRMASAECLVPGGGMDCSGLMSFYHGGMDIGGGGGGGGLGAVSLTLGLRHDGAATGAAVQQQQQQQITRHFSGHHPHHQMIHEY